MDALNTGQPALKSIRKEEDEDRNGVYTFGGYLGISLGIRKEEEEDATGKEWSRESSDKRQLNRWTRLSSLSQSRGSTQMRGRRWTQRIPIELLDVLSLLLFGRSQNSQESKGTPSQSGFGSRPRGVSFFDRALILSRYQPAVIQSLAAHRPSFFPRKSISSHGFGPYVYLSTVTGLSASICIFLALAAF